MISDEALILDYQRGSREAFEELYARYREPLYGFFRRRVPTAPVAEELMQETFLAVIRGAVRYEPRALVRTWLYGIAMNLISAERRKQSRQPIAHPTTATVNPAEANLEVRDALDALEPSEREILMLREYEQLSYAEISHLLRIPVNTVRSRLFRARMALRTICTR